MTSATITTMTPEGIRETALLNFYSAERRAGADPLTANERMQEFAKRLDALAQDVQAEVSAVMAQG